LSEQPRQQVNAAQVQRAYNLLAPVYDLTFSLVTRPGRRQAIKMVNAGPGRRVLEVGVGTGLSLPHYSPNLRVTGIDLSEDMLRRAVARAHEQRLEHVDDLRLMDAANLEYDDESFDTVVAMYVATVVPDPEAMMAELHRVCAPGGEILLINHFSKTNRFLKRLEKGLSGIEKMGLWRPDFPFERIMKCKGLQLVEQRDVQPFGLFTLVRFQKHGQYEQRQLVMEPSRDGKLMMAGGSPVEERNFRF
jgi:phosphatidylethanolamine/phosphatidyl-N-methylethanolamine N-methyltransferase